MKYEDYVKTAKEVNLTFNEDSLGNVFGNFYGFYKDKVIVKFMDCNCKSFCKKISKDTQGVAMFPLIHAVCPLSGKPMLNNIYKSLKILKQWEIDNKLKEMNEDFI